MAALGATPDGEEGAVGGLRRGVTPRDGSGDAVASKAQFCSQPIKILFVGGYDDRRTR